LFLWYSTTVLRHWEKSLKVTVTTILAVGSGAAMDLTKAVLQKGYGKGILVPSTYGAIIASTSSHAMLLDTTEEALVVPDNIIVNIAPKHTDSPRPFVSTFGGSSCQ
jgi:glycerol dehydrogenase-like iron-containing ADH family enzyme